MKVANNETRRLPDYLQSTAGHTLPQYRKQRGRTDYLEKMLSAISSVLAEDLYNSKLSNEIGFLQQIDPRSKLFGVFLLVLAAAMTADIYFLLALQILLASAALSSGMNLNFYFSRTCAPALLFAGIAVFPAVFSWITPGEALVVIHHGTNLYITKQGLTGALFVFLRTLASLGLVLLLVKTTPWPILTKTISSLRIPGIFIMVLDLTYRYIFLFLTLLSDYVLGRKSRLVAIENYQSRFEWIGASLAGFLRLSLEYSREITLAMLSRGYTDDIKDIPASQPTNKLNWRFLAIVIIICTGAWGGNLFAKF